MPSTTRYARSGWANNANELIRPARDGTLRVLKAASAAGVQRVVLTSSIAAVAVGHDQYGDRMFTEDDWTDLDGEVPPYDMSKTLAERAAWEFVEGLDGDQAMELTTINPSYVLGPSLLGVDNASNEIVAKLLRGEMPGAPRMHTPLVDVRDVATAHLLAMTTPEAAGKRFIINGETLWYREIARTLADAGYRVPTRELPNLVMRIVGLFDGTVRLILPMLGETVNLSNARAVEVLGWSYRDAKESILETAAHIEGRASS